MSAACGPHNLVELLDAHREKFYFGYKQWWIGEPFTRILPSDPMPSFPTRVVHRGDIPRRDAGLPRAVDLATHYVQHPTSNFWQQGFRFWCADKDKNGRRVYLHFNTDSGLMELHRWDEPSVLWGVAV